MIYKTFQDLDSTRLQFPHTPFVPAKLEYNGSSNKLHWVTPSFMISGKNVFIQQIFNHHFLFGAVLGPGTDNKPHQQRSPNMEEISDK